MKKKFLSILLVFAMIISMVPSAMAAMPDDGNDDGVIKYVSLGASNVNGYGLRGYIPDAQMEAAELDWTVKARANVLGYKQAPGDSYPVRVAEALGAELTQMAISSMRVEEIRILLDNTYYGDSYSSWRFVGPGKWFEYATGKGLDDLRSEYQAEIASADIITVDIGVNNVGVYVINQIASNHTKFDNDLAMVDPGLAEEFEAGKAYVISLLNEYVPELSAAVADLEELVDTLAYALVGFCVNFDIVMEKIYELNPDASVVAVSIQNLMEGLNVIVPGIDMPLPLGEVFGALINAANVYIAVGSPYAERYKCADVRQEGRVEFFLEDIAEYNGDPASLSQNIIDCFNIYDGFPGNDYDRGLHVKYMLNKAGALTEENLAIAYDVVASILQAAAKINTLDMGALLGDTGNLDDILLETIANEVMTAVSTGNTEYTLSENFLESIAAAANMPLAAVETVATMAVRTELGNSFFGHPNPDGHETIATAVLSAVENETTGLELLIKELELTYREFLDWLGIQGEITQNAIYDATHAEIALNCGDTLTVAGVYAEDFAEVLGAEVVGSNAEADLIIADFNGDGFINYMIDQITGLTADAVYDEIVRNGLDKDLEAFGAEELLAQIEALTELNSDPDWSGFSADVLTIKDEILTIVENAVTELLEDYGLTDGVYSEQVKVVLGMIEESGVLDAETAKKVAVIKKYAPEEMTIVIDVTDLLVKAAESVLNSYFRFASEFPAELDAIRTENPGAQVVVVGLNNNVAASLPGFITDFIDISEYNEYIDYIVEALNLHLFAYAVVNRVDTTYVEVASADAILAAVAVTGEDHDYSIYEDISDDQHKVVCSNNAAHFYAEDHVYADDQDTTCELCGHERTIGGSTPIIPGPVIPSTPSTPSEPEEWSCNGGANCPSCQFTDLAEAIKANKNIWWHESTDYVIKNKLMNGMTDELFMPNYTTTRAMLVTILWREAGSPVVDYTMTFEDVEADTWYTEAIRWAASKGIVEGHSDAEFAPNENVTREQMVTIFYRYAKNNGVNVTKGNAALITEFADVDEVSTWAYDAVKWACGIKFVEGKENNNIDPLGNATRAEMATLIMRFIEDVM